LQQEPGQEVGGAKTDKKARLSSVSGLIAPLSFLLILCLYLSFTVKNFANFDNLKEIAIQASVVSILACGQTSVIISGNIDLSVGANMALAGVVAALMMRDHHMGVAAAVFVSCGVGLIAGTISGIVTAVGKIPSFIVTLGMMGVLYGLASILGNSQNVGGLADGFDVFAVGEFLGNADRTGISYAIIIMVAVAIAVGVMLKRTRFGRAIYAMGGNREAARLSGIQLGKLTVGVFALTGLLAGLAAVINVSRSGIAALDAGNGYELYAVAATVIGGTSLFGGQGGIPGTVIGALLMFTIRNGCSLHNLSSAYERVIVGAVVILAVLYDRYGPGKNRTRAAA
jgi:ribose transport system permease protein